MTDEIILESPPEMTSSASEISAVFTQESIGTMAAKLKLVESLLKLTTRDIPFKDFTRELLMIILHTIKCEAGSIFEINYENQTLFFRAASGRSSDKVSNFEMPLGQGIVGHVAESQQAMLINDIQNNPLHAKAISQAVDFEVHNLIAVPIIIRTRTYGVLELLNRVGEHSFSSSDLDLLNYASDMIARTVEIRMILNWSKKAENRAASDSSRTGVAA
ncbi:MAG TPA: hypothetical protein DCS07_00245 [Bdellovibrionales bacterium]|nr:hypothetical protein [Bdellovibrionales bacterium]HCM41143.1 hypothetical protein [Bdellovibrionales bacterium]